MQRLLKAGSLALLCGAAVAVLISMAPPKAEARPLNLPVFAKQYENLLEPVKVAKCTVCHPMADNQDKKKRNNYGEALEKAIGKKNEKDKAEIIEAMKKVEKEPSAIEGKTFGDLIREGKLPASTK